MQIFNQPPVPLLTPSTQQKTTEVKSSSASDSAGTEANSSNDKPDYSQHKGRAQYPQASPEELFSRSKIAAKRFGFPRISVKPRPKPKPPTPRPKPPIPKPITPKPSPLAPKPAKPMGPGLKPAGGSNSPGAARNTANDIARLQQNNAFPPVSPSVAVMVRNALLTSGTSNLVNSGFTVGQHFVSKGLEERIDAQAKMPGAEVNKPDGTTDTVDSDATEEQKIQARLTGAEINTELLANEVIFINEGPDAKAVIASPDAPTDTHGRLINLEKRMDAIESQMPELAKRYGLIYTPYVAPESSEAPTDQSRMENVEKRYTSMKKMIKTLVVLKQNA
ncbi:type III secretion effector protein [Pseudomonas paralactis]|nr:type III secretion effector protein [Pseudomonas paralactis]